MHTLEVIVGFLLIKRYYDRMITLELTFDNFYTIYNATNVTHLSEGRNDIELLKKGLNLS